MKNAILAIVLSLASLSAVAAVEPYVTGGIGRANVGANIETIGIGVKLTPWLRLEADYRNFGKTIEAGLGQQVGPLVLQPGTGGTTGVPAIYACDPNCHNEQPSLNVKTSGKVISALVTTDNPEAFLFLRLGLMFRTDVATLYPINVYNNVDSTFTNVGPQQTTTRATKPILGFGFSAYGIFLDITDYGNTYPSITGVKHELFVPTIGYRLKF